MRRRTSTESGFTIVELLIVIVVIGILAALVLNSFQGVQTRARDTERLTDINSLSTQLETFYTDNAGYPALTPQLDTDSWVLSTAAGQGLKGADVGIMRPPGINANAMAATATPSKNQYGYTPLLADGTTACSAAPCAKFLLYYLEEKSNTVLSRKSLN